MLYIRFPLSLRNVEDLLHERGIDVSHETVRNWWNRFDPKFAAEIRRKQVQQLCVLSKWKWHLDEVFLKVNGKRHFLSRAVGHEGKGLQTVVTKRRNKQAVLKFFKKSMKRHGCSEEIVTDRFASDCSQRTKRYRKTADGQVVQQPSRELAPSFPMMRTRDAAFQTHAKSTEIRLRPFLFVQQIQPGKIASQPRHLQADPRHRS